LRPTVWPQKGGKKLGVNSLLTRNRPLFSINYCALLCHWSLKGKNNSQFLMKWVTTNVFFAVS
jgi:hypothetical protein